MKDREGKAVSRCRDCGHEQELFLCWCTVCAGLNLDIVTSPRAADSAPAR
jgi:hypothetical protein